VQLVDVFPDALTLGVVAVSERGTFVTDDQLGGALGDFSRFHRFGERVAHSFTCALPQ